MTSMKSRLKYDLMRPRSFFALAALATVLPITAAHAQTIAFDDFDTVASTLNGSVADIGGTWTAGTNAGSAFTIAGGAAEFSGTNGGRIAYLPFSSLSDGFIYDLSADIALTNFDGVTSSAGLGLGFFSASPAVNTNPAASDMGYMVLNRDGNLNLITDPDGVQGGAQDVTTINSVGASANLGMRLDTTGGTGAWEMSFLVNGSTVGSTWILPTAAESNIGSVGIQRGGSGQGTFDNFTVVQSIPEPSTYAALLAMGSLAFLARRRMK